MKLRLANKINASFPTSNVLPNHEDRIHVRPLHRHSEQLLSRIAELSQQTIDHSRSAFRPVQDSVAERRTSFVVVHGPNGAIFGDPKPRACFVSETVPQEKGFDPRLVWLGRR